MDLSEVFTAQVRALQAMYPAAHAALCNWAYWSRDRVGIGPSEYLPPNPVFAAIDRGEWDRDGYGEIEPEGWTPPPTTGEERADRAEQEPYNEREADALDVYLHSRFPWNVRKCLVAAYVSRTAPEQDFPGMARCSHEEFLNRLELVLVAI